MRAKVAVALLLSAGILQADIEVAEGLLKAEAVGMAGLASEPSVMAAGVGVNGVYSRDYDESLRFGAGLSAAMPVVETDDEGFYGGAFLLGVEQTNDGKSGLFFSLNRLYVNYHKPGYDLMAGRFLFDSPLVSSSEGFRIAPDATEAIVATFGENDTRFVAGYLNAFSGPSSGSTGAGGTEKGSFVAMSDAGFGDANGSGGNAGIEDMGLLIGGVQHDASDLTAQGWLYVMPSVKTAVGKGGLQAFYGEGAFSFPVGVHAGTFSAQLLHMNFTDDFDGRSHTILGAQMQMQLNPEMSVEGALNLVSGDGAILEPWGPTPAFASGYEAAIAGLHKGFALRVGGTMALGDLGEQMRQANLTANIVYQSGDDIAWTEEGKKGNAFHLEGVLAALMSDRVSADFRALINGGDAEGVALLARAAYRF